MQKSHSHQHRRHDRDHGHPHEHQDLSLHAAPAVLDIGEDIGALMLYTPSEWHGREIEVSPVGDPNHRTHTAVLKRQANGETFFVALYLALPAGTYTIWHNHPSWTKTVMIIGGSITEIHYH